ncbi:hypothetical protein ACFYXW_02835 [Streptomyces sp. NPDC001981]|uniref:hypothetical protein n=1 Tax=Streptomyces sp. NPDC001981 TaxID=3364628 RepID=UPI0036882212
MGPGLRVSRRSRASYRRLDPVQQHAEPDGERLPGLALEVGDRVVGGRWLGGTLAAPTAEDLAWAQERAGGFGAP